MKEFRVYEVTNKQTNKKIHVCAVDKFHAEEKAIVFFPNTPRVYLFAKMIYRKFK